MVHKIAKESGELLEGTEGSDTLTGKGGIDSLKAYGGDDTLRGGAQGDWIDGGTGIDRLLYDDSNAGVWVSLYTGVGHYGAAEGDTISNVENLTGSHYNDSLFGTDGENYIDGGGGSLDVIYGYGGNDDLKGNGYIFGGIGHDVIRGGGSIYGEAGNDLLYGQLGADRLDGGADIDTVSYENSTQGVTIGLYAEAGAGAGGAAEGDTYYGIENVRGTGGADNIWGDGNRNVLEGLEGADTLKGLGGNDELVGAGGVDTLDGSSGDDVLKGGLGADMLDGGVDIDTADYAGSPTGIYVDLFFGIGSYGFAEGDQLTNIENVIGTTHNDTLVGGEGANVLSGASGHDTIYGSEGNDTLIGGGGKDNFVFDTALNAFTNVDLIEDFRSSASPITVRDLISLDRQIFTGLASGPLSASAFRAGTAAVDADDRIIYNIQTGAISYDADGVGGTAAIHFATLNDGQPLSHLDFAVFF